MEKPALPHDETSRLDALRKLEVLDTPPEERFDRITRLARRLFDVPIALVSLVDSDRQWFKSRQGLDASETPREISFCGHAILQDRVFQVEDAASHERFADNPLVIQAPNIRFYAGQPIAAPGGSKVGTLCLIDRRPRKPGEDDLELLRDLAGMVEQELAALELATLDGLTGLTNRRGFTVLAGHALALARRTAKPLTLLCFDLDGFKQINDECGHAAGDQALVEMANTLLVSFRESDIVVRLGGDEFCLLLSGASEADARRPQSLLDEKLCETNAGRDPAHPLAYGVGVAVLDLERHATLEDLLQEADARMYEHKRARREQGR